jgi:glucose-1-phosphate thymidylyltransferase
MPVEQRNVIGVIPAAGRGERISPLPCSKELFPIGLKSANDHGEARVRVAVDCLLDQFRQAGIGRAVIVLRQGKWDIPAFLGDGTRYGLQLAYLPIDGSSGPPASVDRAYAFVRDQVVAFGFPDILSTPESVYEQLLARLHDTGADAVLGLFPAHDTRLMDMVRTDADGRVSELLLKPASTELEFAWLCAVWSPAYTEFLHRFIGSGAAAAAQAAGGRRIDPQGDLPAGAVMQAALAAGLHVDSVRFPEGTYIDIGTPRDLARALDLHRPALV